MGNKQVKLSFDCDEVQMGSKGRKHTGSRLTEKFRRSKSERGIAISKSHHGKPNSRSPFRLPTRSESGTEAAGSTTGTGTFKVLGYRPDSVSSFILACSSLIHAVQAERGGSCIYCSSSGKKLSESINVMRAVTDEMLARLTQTTMFQRVREMFTWDEVDILRLRVDSLMPFSECFSLYTVLVQRLLDMLSVGLESLRHTPFGSTVTTYILFMMYKEYVGRERGFCGGIITSGGKFDTEKQYQSLVGLKSSQEGLSRAFEMTASKGASEIYKREVAALPEELKEFFSKVLESQEEAEGAMQQVTPEWWFDAMTQRMDVMEAVQGRLIHDLHGELGVSLKDNMLSMPILPDLERSIEDESQKQRERDANRRRSSVEDPNYGVSFVLLADSRDLSSTVRIDLNQKIHSTIGGTIYMGTIPPNRKCSVKVCDVSDTVLIREFIRELSAVGVMRHPNIVKLLGASLNPPKYAMVLEYMDGGNLWEKLRTNPSQIDFLDLSLQLASGVEYIHEVAGLMHRNLKSPNLLLNSRGKLKIAQLGLCCLGEEGQRGQTMEIGTLRWMAPEILMHRPYDQSADIFSLGIILWELLTKQVPFAELQTTDGKLEKPQMVKVARESLRMKLPQNTPKPIRKLLLACWNPNPSRRPKINSVKKTLQDFAATATEVQRDFLNEVHPISGMVNHHFMLQNS